VGLSAASADSAGPDRALRGWRVHLVLFALYLAVGLALAWPTLHWPFVYDDLHLVRVHSRAELLGAWHGSWDPDGIENAGLRPLTMLFNHARTVLFGEDVLAHRVFGIGLFSLYLALLAPLASRIAGTGGRAAVLGGLIVLCTVSSVYHYVWVINAVHMVQGLVLVGAAHLLLRGLQRGSRATLVLSGAVVLAGCLVREDTLVVVPILPLLAWFGSARTPAVRGRLLAWTAALAAAGLALIGWRALAVPEAPSPRITPGGLLLRLSDVANPIGRVGFDGASRVFVLGGWLMLGGLLAWLALSRRPRNWQAPALWFACAVIACCSNTEFQRRDLFFFAASFVGLGLAAALDELARRVPRGPLLAAACAAWFLVGGAYSSRVAAEAFHPDSTVTLASNARFIYGYLAGRAQIPEARRAAAAQQLARHGITSRQDMWTRVAELDNDAVHANRRRPVPAGQAFLPLVRPDF